MENYGTIVSTDECIDYVTNRKTGTIIGGTFLNVIMTGGTIKNAIVKGKIWCSELNSEYVIENVTLGEGAVLEEGCEWYGPLKLNAMFGRTMIEKKDLHAAINK